MIAASELTLREYTALPVELTDEERDYLVSRFARQIDHHREYVAQRGLLLIVAQ